MRFMEKNRRTTVLIATVLAFAVMLIAAISIAKHPIYIASEVTTSTGTTKVSVGKVTKPTIKNEKVSKKVEEVVSKHKENVTKIESVKSKISEKIKKNVEVISQSEYDLICGIVMNETGHGSREGMIAVTQCIKNAMEKEKKDAFWVHDNYGYGKTKTPSEKVKQTVYDVFYKGAKVTDEPILYFYAPALCYSAWHESQTYVCSYDGNKFFKARS